MGLPVNTQIFCMKTKYHINKNLCSTCCPLVGVRAERHHLCSHVHAVVRNDLPLQSADRHSAIEDMHR
jgi:hypothetical protein